MAIEEKIKLCPYYNPETGHCGSSMRRTGDMRYAFGKCLSVIPCDYDKNHDKMHFCPYNNSK